ncbi:hypothetical protein Golomagni_06147 [Golovinomyces magnicellulatus]|nr:hypothetical protein Golomagni_06147 [Golovinomyces magnicellulatus]
MSHQHLVLRCPMARCRWWTRGWTLQELIAPSRVMFYDSSWQYIDDKASLQYFIGVITGINADILVNQGRVLTQSVWQRMSWARSRETTRTEDIAYCLLGLFDISMPLVYGEGYKAFQRLQEEITRKEGDPSIFLWSPDTMPRLAYRPPRYRQSTATPELRGAFAWAPSEFLSPEAYFDAVVAVPRYDAMYTAVPSKVEMSAQSSCTLQKGVICISPSQDEFAGTYPHTYLELYTSRGFMYRPIEKVADGYVFRNRPYCKSQDRLVPQKEGELTLMSHHKTMLLELEERKRVCVGIDSEAMESAQYISWPPNRWEESRSWWVYDDVEVSRASYSMATVLGICWFPLNISIQTSQQLTTNHRITVACVVGLQPSQTMEVLAFQSTSEPRLFGACLVKESMSSSALRLHTEISNHDLKAGAAVIQALSPEKLEKFKPGRGEIIVLNYDDDNLTRIRATCNYPPSAIDHRSSVMWRMNLVFEHEEEYLSDRWVAFDPDEAINIF